MQIDEDFLKLTDAKYVLSKFDSIDLENQSVVL